MNRTAVISEWMTAKRLCQWWAMIGAAASALAGGPPFAQAAAAEPPARTDVIPHPAEPSQPEAKASSSEQSRKYTLEEMFKELAATNPGLAAAKHNLAAAEAGVREAGRAWWPRFNLEAMVAPAVDIRCTPSGTQIKKEYCLEANVANPVQTLPDGVLGRLEVRLTYPVFNFGKLSAGKKVAEAGRDVAGRSVGLVHGDLRLNVRRSYYGIQAARAVLVMVNDGLERLEKALARVEDDLDKGGGRSTETDRLRLRVAEQMVRARVLEAEKGELLALAALRSMIPSLPTGFHLGESDIAPVRSPTKSVAFYRELAQTGRPEAQVAAASREGAKWSKSLAARAFFPDILIVGNYFRLWTSTDYDPPSSPYFVHLYDSWGYGLGLVLRWELDLHRKIPQYDRASETYEASLAGGRALDLGTEQEITTAVKSIAEAGARMRLLRTADKAALTWLDTVAQKLSDGAAEVRDFSDALFAYFDSHGRYIQSIYDYNMAVAILWRVTGSEEAS